MCVDRDYHAKLSMEEIMDRWPATMHVLIGYKMHCLGCALAPYHNARDAAFEHGVDEQSFLKDLREATRLQP